MSEHDPIDEAAAKAMWEKCEPSSFGWDEIDQEHYRELARAARPAILKATRERGPTEAMHKAGNDEMDAMDAGNGHAFCEHIWLAMIDAEIRELERQSGRTGQC